LGRGVIVLDMGIGIGNRLPPVNNSDLIRPVEKTDQSTLNSNPGPKDQQTTVLEINELEEGRLPEVPDGGKDQEKKPFKPGRFDIRV
jgi:hypothetical protein